MTVNYLYKGFVDVNSIINLEVISNDNVLVVNSKLNFIAFNFQLILQ